jgi:hypothetical protein
MQFLIDMTRDLAVVALELVLLLGIAWWGTGRSAEDK